MFLSLNTKVKNGLSVILLLAILALISHQFYNFLFREKLILNNFENNNSIVVSTEYYHFTGQSSHIKEIYINSKEYFIDQEGRFQGDFYLFQGLNKFHFKAITESQKTIKKEILIYRTKEK